MIPDIYSYIYSSRVFTLRRRCSTGFKILSFFYHCNMHSILIKVLSLYLMHAFIYRSCAFTE